MHERRFAGGTGTWLGWMADARGAASKAELVARWQRQPGRMILRRLHELCLEAGPGAHPDAFYGLLDGLPYRGEVPSGRDLRGVSLSCPMQGVDLAGADLSHAQLDVDFIDCDLTGARLDGATLQRVMVLDRLDRASFRGAKLCGCYLRGARARDACFDGAVLNGSSFQDADLRGSSFQDARCRRVDFGHAELVGCDFRRAVLDEALFHQARLDGTTDVDGASLGHVNQPG